MPSEFSRYYKYPEGEDLIGKLAYTCKQTGAIGFGCGVIDAQLFSKPKGYLGALGRIIHWMGPMVGMSAAFVSITYMATNLRKKDDSINYALGGAAAGSIFGTWQRSASIGLLAAAIFAIAGAIKKEGVDAGYEFIGEMRPREFRTLGSPHFDLTLTSHIPGNWTTGREESEE